MIGTSWIREQLLKDPLLVDLLRKRDLETVPLVNNGQEQRNAYMRRWNELVPYRDGPVSTDRVDVTDRVAMTEQVKSVARELGADDVGATALRPEFIEIGVELPYDTIIAVIHHEEYAKALEGPAATDLEAVATYVRCAEISTGLARYIRENLGYPARAHHPGSGEIQAIPVLHEVGFGELGKNGSLIHPEFGAGFRPGFVTTTLPLAHDAPLVFGVQDTCMTCNLCTNNCPADAIPSADYITTNGVKRWLTDVEACYSVSRLLDDYCHICVDVCPYVHKANGDEDKKEMFKVYMRQRKSGGYKTPRSGTTSPGGS